jgi:hypothetical protein
MFNDTYPYNPIESEPDVISYEFSTEDGRRFLIVGRLKDDSVMTIEFSLASSTDSTDTDSSFRIYATVVAILNQLASDQKPLHAECISFGLYSSSTKLFSAIFSNLQKWVPDYVSEYMVRKSDRVIFRVKRIEKSI